MADPIVLHLTDLHLFADERGELKGMRTWASFRAVKTLAWRRWARPDLLLLGGDLAQDELGPTYRKLADELTGWARNVRVTPGNHCALDVLERALLPGLQMPPLASSELRLGDWLVVPLNSHDPACSPGGRLGEAELARLHRLLTENDAPHLMLALHHPPVPLGSAWLDAMMLADADAFWAIVGGCPRVRAVLFGHAHQEVDVVHRGVRLLGSPSTCIQFLPKSEAIAFDRTPPGYRWLRLGADGSIATGVERVKDFPLPALDDTSPY